MECLFCATKKRDIIEIFGDSGKAIEAAGIISKHFWFQLESDEVPLKAVCKSCWKKINDFHLFYCNVEKYHLKANKVLIPTVFVDSTELTSPHKVENESYPVKPELLEHELEIKDERYSDNDNTSLMDPEDSKIDKISSLLPEKSKLIDYGKKRKCMRRTIKPSSESDEDSKKPVRLLPNKHRLNLIGDYFKMECDLCKVEFANWNDVKPHFTKKHINSRGYLTCKLCERKIRRRHFIMDHIDYHLNPNAFTCDLCGKTFECREALGTHKKLHETKKNRVYQCHQCDKNYYKKHTLEIHILKIHTSDEEKNFMCLQCDRRFATQAFLTHHVKIKHDKAYERICEICAKSFQSKSNYEIHRMTQHSEIHPKTQCPDCGKWLKSYSLKWHTNSCPERKDKSVQICNICGKESPNVRAARQHKKYVHVYSKVHQCTFCEKSFKTAITLKEHVASHTGEVLYNCAVCSKTFNSNANKYSHFKKMHKSEWEAAQLKKNGLDIG